MLFADAMQPQEAAGRPLLGRCAAPEAVQWSEDNLLAVVEGSRVLVVNPADPRATAAVTGSAEPKLDYIHVDLYPDNAPWSVAYMQGFLQARNVQQQTGRAELRSIAWSPTGCSAAGHCLLGTVSSMHEVGRHERCIASRYYRLAPPFSWSDQNQDCTAGVRQNLSQGHSCGATVALAHARHPAEARPAWLQLH